MKQILDKRSCPRVPLTDSASVPVGKNKVEVTIGNISLSGVMFHSDWSFKLGEIISIIFKGVSQGKSFNETVLGKIVTVSRKESGNSYGLKFSTYLIAEKQSFLTAFVNQFSEKGVSFLRDPEYGRAERKD